MKQGGVVTGSDVQGVRLTVSDFVLKSIIATLSVGCVESFFLIF